MSIMQKLKEFFIRLLVKHGQVKSAPVEISEIESMVNDWLPEDFDIEISGGNAELKIISLNLSSKISKGNSKIEKLNIILFCNFKVKMNGSTIFNTHLNLKVIAEPDYSIKLKSIGVKNAELVNVDLINDKDSFIKDVSNLANGLLPSPLKGLFNVALASSKIILGEDVVSGMTRYLSIYNSGNQQKIVDYHRTDIENKIAEISLDPEMRYELDETDFQEKLFFDFGKSISLQKGVLQFCFE